MDAGILGLDDLFGHNVSYRIPVFQRPYAWTQETQWLPLWEDVRDKALELMKAPDEDVAAHFMGAIILQSQHDPRSGPKVDRHIVVDGQQRLTTLQLLIRAVQQCFRNLADNERANELQNWTENEEKSWDGDKENQTKVRQSNVSDRTSFQDVIREGAPRDTIRRIDEAFNFFLARITEWLDENPSERAEKSEALKNTLTAHMKVATVDLDTNEKPHFIFSVLNARAEPLLESDHIKNEIMYRADVVDDEQKARDLWGFFENNQWWRRGTQEGRLSRIHLDRFLNYWTAMKTEMLNKGTGADVSADRVYGCFKRVIEADPGDVKELAAAIWTAGQIYMDIEEARQPGIKRFLKRLKTMELGVVVPLLLWLYTADVSESERTRSTQALESYLVRRVLCGQQSQGLNRLFFELLGKLCHEEYKSVSEVIVDFLKDQTAENRIWPKDLQIIENVIGHPMKGTASRQVMVLEAIEQHIRTDMAEPLGEGALSREHIMPDSWQRNWPLPPELANDEESLSQRGNAVNEIGNLTLVTQKLNSALSNEAWESKRETLRKHTTLRLNIELLDIAGEVWDEDAILNRSAWMAKNIVEIWPYADKL